MDLKMPLMDGYEATIAIRQREDWRQIPIIALTAHARSEDRTRCLAVGMNDFLAKPVKQEQLFTLIEKHLAAAAGQDRRRPNGKPASPVA
jgi:CheY-like chemotaxis protein